MVLKVDNLTYSINNKVLYEDASFLVDKKDHLGIVGMNGTGKTTLINILIKKIEPDKGEINWQKGIRYGYLDQHAEVNGELTIIEFLRFSFDHLFEVEKELNSLYEKLVADISDELNEKISEYQNKLMYSGFYDIDATIHKVALGLGVVNLGMDTKLHNLSGGQRAKVILTKLLLESPDVLIMDEPTNFLDIEQVNWLAKFLKEFEGAFIIISHDFSFLNEVTNCILDIEFQKIKKYTGNYQQFISLKDEHKKNYQQEYEKQQKEMKHLQEYYDRWHAGTKAKSAQSRLKQLEKIKDVALDPLQTLSKPTFTLSSLPINPGNILKVEDLVVGYTKQLLPPINFSLNGEEKIAISGFNGIGKSTLIKTILNIIKPISGTFEWNENVKIGYFDQDLTFKDKSMSAFAIIRDAFPNIDELSTRKALARCAIKDKHVMQPVSLLSGGEQVKVKLCILSLQKNNVLILDEPTNHIDVLTKEVLKEELIKWKGSVIIITHEQDFIEGWINRTIKINK